MKVLIVFATSEGQTRKIAAYMAAELTRDGHETTVYDSAQALGGLDLKDFGAIFVAGSVHEQGHQEELVDFVVAHRERLKTTPSAFLSVSLSAAKEAGEPEARSYVDRFIQETGWTPAEILLVAGALRYSEYDYFRQQIVDFIVLGDSDKRDMERDHEFTDWDDVGTFARSVVKKAGG